jgi:hypothetical protein
MNLDDQSDPVTMYAPRWVHEKIAAAQPGSELQPLVQSGGDGRKLAKSHLQFSGDRAMLELQRQLSLDPGLIPEPCPEGRSSIGPILFRLCGALGFAVIVTWGIVTYSVQNKALVASDLPEAVAAENLASLTPRGLLGLVDAAGSQLPHIQQSEPIANPPGVVAVEARAGTPLASIPGSEPTIAAAPNIAASDASATRSSAAQPNGRPALQLATDELEMLLKRGKEFLADGDLASARLLLRRAAEGGSAEAALVLGTTFDPLVISRLGVIGAHPDIDEARQWYQRAAELGSNTASQRLSRLAAAP